MILNIFRKKTKISGYQSVKNKVANWVSASQDAERKGMLNVKLGIWHERDLYQALLSLNQSNASLVSDYGRKYIKAGGDNSAVLSLVDNKGALVSVAGVLEFLNKNGVNVTRSIYTIDLLSASDNGVNIAKALYSELSKRDVKKSLSYGLWAAIKLNDTVFSEHVLKRLSWCDDSKVIEQAFDQVFSVEGDLNNSFLSLVLQNLSAQKSEKLVRMNLEKLDINILAETLVANKLDHVYRGVLKKVAANIWSDKNYLLASNLYKKLLMMAPEPIIAERYYLSCERSGSICDTSLPFISEIETGLSLFDSGRLPNTEWFKQYPTIARFAIDEIVFTGNLSLALDVCTATGFVHNKLEHWKDLLLIEKQGLTIPNKSSTQKPYNNKVAYLLYNSLPVHSGGYATRSHGIISNLMSKGVLPHVMTRLGYPYDLNKFKSRDVVDKEEYDGITYHRLLNGPGLNFVPVSEYLSAYVLNVKEQLLESDASIVHAASNHINGIASVIAGRELGLKTIFEVRGMWEVTRLSRQPEWEGSDEFKAYRYLETLAALKADVVITITEALKNELIGRGVGKDKIHVVSNGVDTNIFTPMKPNLELKTSLGINKTSSVIGYVGSIVDYEGLDILVDAVGELVNSGKTNITALIVGDGVVLNALKEQVSKMNLNDYFVFTGRIPHDEVPNYYSIIDVCPFPRRGLPVCELVSPLKPFEAMAMGKVVIGSNVQAIAEFIEEGINGFVHEKDNARDLAKQISRSIENDGVRESLKLTTREWVVNNRDWKVLADKVFDIYASF